VSTTEGLAALGPDWRRLAETSAIPNVFVTFEWAWAWWQHIGRHRLDTRMFVVRIHRDGVTTGVVPLVLRRQRHLGVPVRRFEFLGGELVDYGDLLLSGDPPEQARALALFLRTASREWDVAELRNITPAAGTPDLLAGALRAAGLTHRRAPDGVCPYLPISRDWPSYLAVLSGRTRKKLRANFRGLQRSGPGCVRIRIVHEMNDEVFCRMMELEAQRVGRKGEQVAWLNGYPHFSRSLIDSLSSHGALYVALMEAGNELVAYQVGFRCGRKMWLYDTAFNERYGSCSPGVILLTRVLEYAFEHGCEEYDFLLGDEEYKRRWATHLRQNEQIRVWSPAWRARALSAAQALRNRLFGLAGPANHGHQAGERPRPP
jgi:CelD/BcsL family acetyltransferase involved in cellulose biosynthesis